MSPIDRSLLSGAFDRRSFVQIGAFALGGALLPTLSRGDDAPAPAGDRSKAIINIHLGGGPSHQDIFDLKPEAAREFRGDFSPISTSVAGLQICEHMPLLAAKAERWSIVRSLVGMHGEHSNQQTHSGYGRNDFRNVGGAPSMGAVAVKRFGSSSEGAPAFVAFNEDHRGYLGASCAGYKPGGADLRPVRGLTDERLANRTSLLGQLDGLRRDVDSKGQMTALDSFTRKAAEVISSGKIAEALDFKKADPKAMERYGGNDLRNFLIAGRLVDAGVRVVSFNWGGWDTHQQNFTQLKKQLPKMDRGLTALLDDLEASGRLADTTIVVWGEFGRTPRVNKNAGRDHWNRVSTCFLAGGGLRGGQAIGATDRTAAEAKDRPVHVREVFATLYRCLGIDVKTTQFVDPSGRPQYLTDGRSPLAELV